MLDCSAQTESETIEFATESNLRRRFNKLRFPEIKMFGHHVFDERWIRVLESVVVPAEDRFEHGPEPTEQEKMRIPSIYGLYERLKILVDMLKIKVTYMDLLQLVEGTVFHLIFIERVTQSFETIKRSSERL